MDEIKATKIGEILQIPGLAGLRSRPLPSIAESSLSHSTMESPAESMSVEWTDEKHSLYLKCMEASFVNDLYDSMELLGWCSNNTHLSQHKSTKQTHPYPSVSPAQFKVLRSGCWRKINFERAESKETKGNESRDELLSNPWILHFSSAHKLHGSQETQVDVSRWRLGASTSKHCRFFRSNLRYEESNRAKNEVSDQNFVDEDNDGEKKKRERTQELDHCSANDQVVPLHKPQ